MKLFSLLLLAVVSVIAEGLDYRTIVVYNSKNEAIPSCLEGADDEYSISELPSIVTSDTLVRICSEVVVMRKTIIFSNVSNVSLFGYDNPTLQCLSETEAGLVFAFVKNLSLSNFAVDGCGMIADIDDGPNIKASLTIKNSTNIALWNVAVSNGSGTGLAMLYNNGSIKISTSVFEKNGRDMNSGGGHGVYVETGPSISDDKESGLYTFTDSNFIGNAATTSGGNADIDDIISRFGDGGGLCMNILSSEELSIAITNCVFVNNKAERYGGGLFISYVGKSRNNYVYVANSRVITNTGTYGGGAYLGYLHTRQPDLQTPLNCSYRFRSIQFFGNDADFGGGSSLISSKTQLKDSGNVVIFEQCWWMNDVAQYGSAIALVPSAWSLYDEGYLPTVRFIGCEFEMNMVREKHIYAQGKYTQYLKGVGAFYCLGHNVSFEYANSFVRNSGSAMFLGSCLCTLTDGSTTSFSDNEGYQGGAIYELSSVIYVQNNANLLFRLNRATDKGGAIYQSTLFTHTFGYSKTCFIDYAENIKDVTLRNITVFFGGNTANYGGHSIYASSLHPCYNRFSISPSNLSVNIFDQVGEFTFTKPDKPLQIITAINHSIIADKTWSGVVEVIPGKEIAVPFFDIDDLNQNVTTNYLVTIQNDARDNHITTSEYSLEVSNNILLLYGPPHSSATVTLSDTTSRQWTLSFKVEMQPCPPGFIQDDQLQSCICSVGTENSYSGVAKCNLTLMRAHWKRGYWLGYKPNCTEGEDTLVSGVCPQDFCSYNHEDILPGLADRENLNQVVCSGSRTGFLCGQCKANFSVYYHSTDFKCKSNKFCTWGWLFYLLSEIVPVTIVFLIIIVFNMPFTSGVINGFIFYCQVVEALQVTADGLIPFSAAAKVVNKMLSLVYASFALDFFVLDELSFCLWKGADAIALLAFKYVTLVYALFLIFLITLFLKKYRFSRLSRYGRLVSKNNNFQGSAIHGMSAFIILCYAQCVRSAVLLLTSTKIYYKGGEVHKTVVFYNGEMQYMSMQHVLYAIPAIISILFIVILPPILLIIYPLHYKLLSLLRIAESRCVQTMFRPLEKFKPFFDSFQGCFKDEFRFFSGLYFVYRFFIMFSAVINVLKDTFVIVEIGLIAMLVFHSVCQPYKKHLHNVMDALLFGNLAIINAITYYHFSRAEESAYSNSVTVWIQTVLIILPLPLMLLYLATKLPFVKKCCRKRKDMSDSVSEDAIPARLNYGSYDRN